MKVNGIKIAELPPPKYRTDTEEAVPPLPSEFWEAFGARLRKKLEEQGKTQAWLAKKLGVTPAAISKTVGTGSISLQRATSACLLLNCSLDELVFGNKTRLPTAEVGFVEQMREWLAKAPLGLGKEGPDKR